MADELEACDTKQFGDVGASQADALPGRAMSAHHSASVAIGPLYGRIGVMLDSQRV